MSRVVTPVVRLISRSPLRGSMRAGLPLATHREQESGREHTLPVALTWANCFWLLLPILAWNMVFGARITQEQITSDVHSPAWLLGAENLFRLATFALPLFLPLPRGAEWQSVFPRIGLIVYVVGTLVYFASWLPLMIAPQSAWSLSIPGLLAPRLTPLIALLGIALIAGYWPYGLLATVFVSLHTWHGVQNL